MRGLTIGMGAVLIAAAFIPVAATAAPPLGGETSHSPVPLPMGQDDFEPAYTTTTVGGYDAAGTGLRNLGSGTITLDAIPSTAVVTTAFLYWQIQADSEDQDFRDVTLEGRSVAGQKLGSGKGLCWASEKTFAYRANVTPLVRGAGDYAIDDVESAQTDGQDPGEAFGLTPEANGASLVAVYATPSNSTRQVTILDGYRSLIGGSVTVDLTRLPVDLPGDATDLVPGPLTEGPYKATAIVGDGQTNFGDRTLVNGEPVALGNWDGSDPQRIPDYDIGNLWDTDTFDVTDQADSGDLSITIESDSSSTPSFDCLGPTAFVYSAPLP